MDERWLVAWLLAALAFSGASLIVPLYVVELGADPFVLGVLFATASFVGVPGALVFGGLADRTGKRRVFVLSAMAVTVLTMVAIPLLESVALVIVANALLWLGFAASLPVLTLLTVAGEPEEQWTPLIARLNKFQGIGWALGLALGLVVITGGARFTTDITAQRAFFFACATSAGIGLLIGVRTLPPDPKPSEEPSPRRLQRRVRGAARFNIRGAAFPFTPSRFDPRSLHPRRFVNRFTPKLATYFLAVLLVFTGFGVFFAPLPAYLGEVGYSSSQIFGLYLVLNAGAAVFYGYVTRLTRRYDIFPVHVGGLLARALALPAVAAVGGLAGGTLFGGVATAVVFVAIGLTWAVIAVTAAALVTTLASPVVRGEALGMYSALVALGGGIGGLLGGWLAAFDYLVAFGVAGGVVLAGATVVLFASSKETPLTSPEPEST